MSLKELDCNALFNDSYEYINASDTVFYETFYKNFIASSPGILEAFANTNMHKQQEMLRHAIVNMVNFFVTRQADEYLIRFAMSHHTDYRISDNLYDDFMGALLRTLASVYPRYSKACGIAWRITLAPGIEFMKHAYELEEGAL